ncbi:uncharacterized protein kmr isoform X2 [Chelonus insularis]|uniref:uncharacterized protein kmr isoform X2 n=1 Tax=Chelonus insularis TaxID=460826 RepID=UPI00158942D5|nr:uncharacterized protein LOC118074661 isoform X2 [Chelonus insularis]
MVSFKTNNCSSEHSPAHCHHLGTLCSPLRHCSNSYPLSQGHSHDRTLPSRCTPPRTTYPLSHGCALHSRLDQPVTSSTSAMDDKKVVQAAPAANSGQQARVKNSLDGSGVVASISGARRRSGPQGLRSPAAKRPLSAPVALQGWLHKQGSEGLMLWKKRWFVLSEYCLFYYKGPEEEKLLGSILLPSYRITVCKPEDKVNKKFAFKAEHANMRTYHFAADTRESMNQWVNALTLASLLQDPNPSREEPPVALEIAGPADEVGSARPSVSSISSILNQSADDSDSGFHGLQSRDDPSQSNNNSSPNSINTASFPNLSASNSNHGIANSINNNNNHHSPEKIEDNQPRPMVNGWMQPPPQFNQPSTSSQQYGHMMPNSAQLQLQQQAQMHPQHQALMHQRMVRQQHQNAMQHQHQHMVQQQQQMQQQSASNVQTVQPMPRNFGQHVYANAPPKPRRLTDGSTEYSTPSPDPDFRKSPVQPNVRMSTKSPIPDYERVNSLYASRLATQSTPPIRTDKSGLNYGYSQSQPSERRTPDAYGRSAKPRNSRGNGDYEDIYSGPQLYQRPPGPVGYSKGSAPIPISVPMYVQQHQSNQIFTSIASNPPVMRQQRVQPPPRPHSADFLEYEATRKPSPQPVNQNGGIPSQQRRPQRPKSSLDVVGPSEITSNGDGYYYSEERYAAQMRQSAVYLHQNPQHHQQQRNQSLSRATTPSKSSSRVEDHNESITLNEISCSAARRSPRESQIYRQHPVATQSLQRYPETNDAMVRRSLRERNYDPSFHDSLIHGEGGTVPRRIQRDYESSPLVNGRLVDPLESHMSQSYHSGHSGSRRWNDQQFSRSASARLPRTRHPNASDATENDYERGLGQPSRDGERRIQQREESMKRLLEWKQRMLQSPLTRKPSGSANGNTRAQSELSSYYKRQVLLDLAAHEASVEARHSRRREDSHRPHVRSKSSDGRRSVANVSRYNSYSSDDEEPGDVRRKRTRRPSHAGRSPRQTGDENADTNPGDQDSAKGRSNSTLSSVSFTSALFGGIPPDAGYEEVSFPPLQDCTTETMKSIKDNDLIVKIPKKPGILKTPSSFPNRQSNKNDGARLNTLAGYIPGETWQTTKNVQWDSTEDKENWDSKIDESKVIKEFSYQYIKAEEVDEKNQIKESVNLVQNRIKSFESSIDEKASVKEIISMQDPLKLSPPQATEAHVAKVELSRQGNLNIREFALGNGNHGNINKVNEMKNEEKPNDTSKSVKDLLADFERKSQQVRHQENSRREEIKHRGVFSDTETLLYDTGSDLDQLDKSEEEVDERKNVEQKQLHENSVEKSLCDKKEIKGAFKETFHSQETIAGLSIDETPDAFARLSMTESMVTHGDELSTKGDDSPEPKIEDINPEDHYLPMSPRKAILDPNDDDRPDPKMMKSLFANLRHEESSYVEMTQNGISHSLLAPNENDNKLDSGDYSTLDASHYEFVCVADNKMEPVYMELNQLAEKEEKESVEKPAKKKDSSENNQRPARTDLPDILTTLKSDSSDADDESSRDLDSIDAPRHPRFSLSDTFRPASYYLGASRTLIAELHDSSDSELVSPPPIPTSPPPMDDLDSLDMQETLEVKKCSPQVPVNRDSTRSSPKSWNKATGQVETPRPPSRFSEATISSTFRDSRISLESASGSDSLELRNPDEEARHRRMKRRPVSDEVCEVLDSLDELESLGSRFDGASIDLDQYLEELQARDAFNLVDLYAKDLSYNRIYGLNENMLVTDKIQKTTSQEMSKISLNPSTLDQPFHYNSRTKTSSVSSLPSIRVSDKPSPSHQHSQSFTGDAHYENVARFSPVRSSPAVRSEGELMKEDFRCQKNQAQPHISHTRDSSYPMTTPGGSNAISASYQRPNSALSMPMASQVNSIISGSHTNSYCPRGQSPYNDQRTRNHSRSASQDSARYSLSPNHQSSSSQDSNHISSSSVAKTTTQNTRNSPRAYLNQSNNQQNEENDQSGAPYYYSDLQVAVSGAEKPPSRPAQTLIAHTSRLPQLNNQRDDSSGLNKRNDISRLVNPINRQMPRRIEVEDIDEARRIAAELRKTSSQFLADTKSRLVDKRNFYESDTLRRVKSTDPLSDVPLPDVSTINLYPHGLRDKSGSQTQLATGESIQEVSQAIVQPSHRRSRSLEGLLDDVGLQNLVEQRNRANRVSSVPPTNTQVENNSSRQSTFSRINSEEPFEGEETWEQDTLWRESLRRVSLRHARSLDNLDSPGRSGEVPNDTKARPKITRGATYVNEAILQRLTSPEDSQERPRVKRRVEVNESEVNQEDDGAYESLAMDRSAGGYIWNPTENESFRQSSQTNSSNFLDQGNLPQTHQQTESRSFEFDREKLRQWDLLSSACLLQEQQRTSMAESGRGLPERRILHDGQDDVSTMIMMMEEERRIRKIRTECSGNKVEMIDGEKSTEEKENGRGEWHFGTGAGFRK